MKRVLRWGLFYQWLLVGALGLVVIGLVVRPALQRILYTPNFYEDNRYNMALVLRNAEYPSDHFLETSLVHVFFEYVPIPRPEDWHRSYYLIVLTLWAKLVGSEHEILLRLPHLAVVLAWVLLAFALCRAILKSFLGASVSQRIITRPLFITSVACAVTAALGLSQWIRPSLTGAFLDDVPSACLILAGLLVLLGGKRIQLWRVAIFGLVNGVAAGVKDIYLLWLPIGALAVMMIAFLEAPPTAGVRSKIVSSLALGSACALMTIAGFAPKLIWTLYDFGVPVKNLSQYIHISTFFNTWPKTRHYPYFVFDDASYASPIALAGGWREAITLLVQRTATEFLLVIGQTSQVIVWFLPIILFVRTRLWAKPVVRRLVIIFCVTILGYTSFFMLGLGEAKNPRYWFVPITLVLATGVASCFYWLVCHVIPWWRGDKKTGWRRAALNSVAIVLVLELMIAIYPPMIWPADPKPLLSPDMALKLEESTGKTERVLLDTPSAIYYWSVYPDRSVVAFPTVYVTILPSEAIDKLLNVYDVHWALLSDDDEAVHRLMQLGFKTINQTGKEIILNR